MKKYILRNIIFYLVIFLPWIATCQFKSASIGINGLTCSMCSKSVKMSLVKSDFVDRVAMDLNSNHCDIFFIEDEYIPIDKIAQAVIDTWFSVAYLIAWFDFNGQSIYTNSCCNYAFDTYQFLNTRQPKLAGKMNLKFIGTNFLSRSEMKKWRTQLSKAQELFIHNESASNVPKGVRGIRLFGNSFNEISVRRNTCP